MLDGVVNDSTPTFTEFPLQGFVTMPEIEYDYTQNGLREVLKAVAVLWCRA